jgi:hypothetical protein
VTYTNPLFAKNVFMSDAGSAVESVNVFTATTNP